MFSVDTDIDLSYMDALFLGIAEGSITLGAEQIKNLAAYLLKEHSISPEMAQKYSQSIGKGSYYLALYLVFLYLQDYDSIIVNHYATLMQTLRYFVLQELLQYPCVAVNQLIKALGEIGALAENSLFSRTTSSVLKHIPLGFFDSLNSKNAFISCSGSFFAQNIPAKNLAQTAYTRASNAVTYSINSICSLL